MPHSMLDNKSKQKENNLVRVISQDGAVMVLAADTTDVVARAEWIHRSSAVVTAGLGRLLTAGGLMGALLKSGEDRLTLKMKADGPMGGMIVAADAFGHVKGYPFKAVVELPPNEKGKLDVGGAVCGKEPNGFLYVIRDNGRTDPYMGQVPLVSGEVAEDIAAYYANSEQTPTVCGLGVLVNPDLTPQAAGGFLLQLLPGATEETIAKVEANCNALPSVTQMLTTGMSPKEMAFSLLEGLEPQLLDVQTLRYQCDCNRDKTERALISLGKKGLQEILDSDGKAELCCHFCEHKFHFNRDELTQLLQSATDR